MRKITLQLIGLVALAAFALHAQPTNGAVYWSTTQPDCSSLSENPVAIKNSSGTTLGYSCYVSGTFVWFAAGGGWGTAIRVAAPASAPVGVDYSFYDTKGNNLNIDVTGSYSATGSNDVNFALFANQPAEIDLRGASSNAPGYGNITVGSAYAVFFCPDAATCGNVLPQLIYSNLPSTPWSLSVPLAWDGASSTQWSAVGVDTGHQVSLVIYNEDLTATSYKVSVYDNSGKLVGSATTPSVPPLQNSGQGEGGIYETLLSDLIRTMPSGVFKVLIDGGSLFSAVQVLQFTGPAATTLQVAYDSPPTSTSGPTLRAAILRPNVKTLRVESTPKPVFPTLPR